MKLSEILDKMNYNQNYTIENEKDFETLGLVGSAVNKNICTFIENVKYIKNIQQNTKMIITTADIYNSCKLFDFHGVCVTQNPKTMFFRMHNYLKCDTEYSRKSFETKVGKNCIISNNAIIAKDNVIIGDNCVIEDYVVIKENTEIGNNVVLRSGCILSREGFEFKTDGEEVFHVDHLGKVLIGNNVEVQNLTCIDRAIYPWDATIIGDNSKIDCLCQIGHGAKIGKNLMLAGSSSIGGRSIIGDNVVTGGRVSIMHGGLKIGNNAFIGLGSVVVKNIKEAERVFGNPAKKIN